MPDLSDLIRRVESATGPNLATEVSLAILLNTAPEGFRYVEETQGWQRYVPSRDSVELWMPPAYTDSLDAALALVEEMLPGTRWTKNMAGEIWLWLPDEMSVSGERRANDALSCIDALLRALQSQPAQPEGK